MQPYQDRVVTELNELRDRLDKLLAFIDDTETNALPEQDRKLLILQGASMATYIFILEQRIDRFVE